MANEKTYSAKEAAMAVLAKAKELLAKSSLTKQPETLKKSAEFTSGLHTVEYYEPLAKAASMKKDDSISSGIAAAGAAGGVPHTTPAGSTLGAIQSMGSGFGKNELNKKYEGFKAVEESAEKSGARDPAAVAAAAGRKKYGKEAFQHAAAAGKKMGKGENPDEKQDAQLGEDVEGLCERHMSENKDAERKEGHKIVKSEMCKSCKMEKDENIPHPSPEKGEGTTLPRSKRQEDWMEKGEVTELFQDLAKMEVLSKGVAQPSASLQMKEKDPASDKAQGAGNKEKPSSAPEDHSNPIERDHQDFETKPGQSAAPDHREEPQTPPQANPHEQAEGNNPPAGAVPGKGLHKLMYFKGHTDSKKKMKKGICLG